MDALAGRSMTGGHDLPTPTVSAVPSRQASFSHPNTAASPNLSPACPTSLLGPSSMQQDDLAGHDQGDQLFLILKVFNSFILMTSVDVLI